MRKKKRKRRKRGGRPKTRIFAYTRASHQTPIHFFRRAFCIRATRLFSAPSFSPLFFHTPLVSLSRKRVVILSLSLFLSSWRIIMVTILGMRGKQTVIFHRNELFSGIFLPSIVLLWLPRRDKMGREFFGPRDTKHGFDRAQATRRY